MGYIECEDHGGNVAALVSKYHLDKANRKEKCVDSEILSIQVIDQEGLFNGNYIADPSLINEIGIEGLKIDFQTDQEKYEAMLDALSLICPICLKNYFKKD